MKDWCKEKAYALFRYASPKIKWSILHVIGQSNIVKFTILAPFIGYFIIFNTHLQNLLMLSSTMICEDCYQINMIIKLYFFYFGLLALGVASIIYMMLAPTEIKSNGRINGYISEMRAISTKFLVRRSFENVLYRYASFQTWNKESDIFEYKSLALPEELETSLHRFIQEKYLQTLGQNEIPDEISKNYDIEEEIIENEPHFMTGSGYIDTEAILDTMYSNPKITWGLTEPIFEAVCQSDSDVFLLEFDFLDYSKFYARLCSFSFYTVGFTLLFIPTLMTIYEIIS